MGRVVRKNLDLSEFFRDGAGMLSSSRLLAVLSWLPATYITLKLGTESAMGVYLGAFVLNYLGGKLMDTKYAVGNK